MKIARVFPRKTNMTPCDPDVYFGPPDLFTTEYDEIHISVTFTWDLEAGDYLKQCWESRGKTLIGGPATWNNKTGNFVSGRYLKTGVTITSRGCPNNCPWCFVPKREGKIKELPIVAGNIIQDNNLLACSKSHISKVFSMLKTQKHIDFSGGLDADLITDDIVDQLRGLNIYQLWLAYDHAGRRLSLIKAVNKLKKYFKRDQIRCYVLIGQNGDTIEKAEARLKNAWNIGTLPFAMRYRADKSNFVRSYAHSARDWNLLSRRWTRPAIMKSIMSN